MKKVEFPFPKCYLVSQTNNEMFIEITLCDSKSTNQHTQLPKSQLSKAIKDPTAHAKNQFQTSCCQELLAPSEHREVEINRMKQFTLEVQSAATAGIQLLPVVRGRDRTAVSTHGWWQPHEPQPSKCHSKTSSAQHYLSRVYSGSMHWLHLSISAADLQHLPLLWHPQNDC